MNPGCLFGFILWLFGRELQNPKQKAAHKRDSHMSEGEIHSGPGGYEGGSYSGGYAEDYLNEEH